MLQRYGVEFKVDGLEGTQILEATGNTVIAAANAAMLDAKRRWPNLGNIRITEIKSLAG